MFELFQQRVKLSSVNPRAEIHGDKKKPACDLKFEYSAPNEVLHDFNPNLLVCLYTAPEDQADLIEPGRLSQIRFPKMGAFKWDLSGKGYTLDIEYGIGGPSNIALGGVDIDGFKLVPQNGGTVIVVFRAIVHPDEVAFGKLCSLVQQDITLTLRAPEPQTVGELFGDEPQEQETADAE
ncbi:hypothetical protein [Cupriavidus pinatubonensis]|uniref:hypothetical protein n=1 Tax=Cupriavidus pinatubonensis TaxID=248026 RepID=UPI003608974A